MSLLDRLAGLAEAEVREHGSAFDALAGLSEGWQEDDRDHAATVKAVKDLGKAVHVKPYSDSSWRWHLVDPSRAGARQTQDGKAILFTVFYKIRGREDGNEVTAQKIQPKDGKYSLPALVAAWKKTMKKQASLGESDTAFDRLAGLTESASALKMTAPSLKSLDVALRAVQHAAKHPKTTQSNPFGPLVNALDQLVKAAKKVQSEAHKENARHFDAWHEANPRKPQKAYPPSSGTDWPDDGGRPGLNRFGGDQG